MFTSVARIPLRNGAAYKFVAATALAAPRYGYCLLSSQADKPEGEDREALLRSLRATTSFDSDQWAWVPPKARNVVQAMADGAEKRGYSLPVIRKKYLTESEIRSYLEAHGAEDIWIRTWDDSMTDVTTFAIASFKSKWQIRPVATGLLRNVKQRGLFTVGIDGEKNDAWQCVDCSNAMVHLFRRDVREAVNLEDQLLNPTSVQLTGDAKQDEILMEEWREKNPEHPNYLRYLEETDDEDGPDDFSTEEAHAEESPPSPGA